MNAKRIPSARLVCLLALFALAGASLIGCAAKKQPWGDRESGLILTYRMDQGKPLSYRISSDQTQQMEVGGQSMETTTSSVTEFSADPKSKTDDGFRLGVTIDSMTFKAMTPQGEISADLSGVIGKSFEMTLSSLGVESDLSGADEIQMDLGPGGKRSVSATFQGLFPTLAGKPVKVGDSWTSTDRIVDKSDRGEVEINVESLNTLDGFETVDGTECARVASSITGTVNGGTTEDGMQLDFDGSVEGKDSWYFAYENGLFVKGATGLDILLEITTGGPQGMKIPVKQKLTIETVLTDGL